MNAVNFLEIPSFQSGVLGMVCAFVMVLISISYKSEISVLEENINRLFKTMAAVIFYVAVIFLGFGCVDIGAVESPAFMLNEDYGLRYVMKFFGGVASVAVADWATQTMRDEKRSRR